MELLDEGVEDYCPSWRQRVRCTAWSPQAYLFPRVAPALPVAVDHDAVELLTRHYLQGIRELLVRSVRAVVQQTP